MSYTKSTKLQTVTLATQVANLIKFLFLSSSRLIKNTLFQ